MRTIKNNINRGIFMLVLALLSHGCTKDNFWYSGISNGIHDCSLLEYMESHSYDWDSTALMVRHAGEKMLRIFEGKDTEIGEITFFGPTNHSIRRYMLSKGIKRVQDMDPLWCEQMLSRYIVKGKIFRDDVPIGIPGTSGVDVEGGKTYTALAGNRIYAYSHRTPYNGLEDVGAITVYLISIDHPGGAKILEDLASTNIQPNNCVVHSLQYFHTLGDM